MSNELVYIYDFSGRFIEKVELNQQNSFTYKMVGYAQGMYFVRNNGSVLKVIVSE
ncbi:MAG: T9SS type A sorting domain-containing protein [Sphingobacteriaceae bacterium]|nr:T9SS type A sorting domain-containing protein [Sphingobacteriaceae bacterium]